MKFDCGETWEEKEERLGKWHDFFCIFPRKVGDHDCRWFETIERRMTYHIGWDSWWSKEYRAKEKK